MEKFDAALAQITVKLAELADKHGADAISLAGFVLQMKAAKTILSPIPPLILGTILLYVAWRLFPRVKRAIDDCCDNDAIAFFGGFSVIVCGVFGTVMFIAASVCLLDGAFNPLTWAATFDPHVAIAAEVLGALK